MLLALTLDCLEALAAALVANNGSRQAVRLWSAIEAFRRRVGNVRAPVEQPGYDQYLALARRALGDAVYEAEWRAGAAQTWEQATDEALLFDADQNAVAPTSQHTATSEYASELALAAEVQAGLLPASMPQLPGWRIAAALYPALETAGDFYDCIALADGRLLFVIADVAGKGLGAALYMATGRALIRSLAASGIVSPAALLEGVNTRLLEDTHAGLFITAYIGLLEPASGRLTYANAGHPPAIVCTNASERGVRLLGPTGLVLGVEPGVTWREETLTLEQGEQLLLYTDGVTEAQDTHGAFFETERLLTTVRGARDAEATIAKINTTVTAFAGDASQFDDMTLLAVQRIGQTREGR
jgi:serine phosphatase RsbU (regulator of sigma subunit)